MPTSILSTLLAQPTTLMPCWTSARATAAPIPTEAPVTRATLPFHRSISTVLSTPVLYTKQQLLHCSSVCLVQAVTVAAISIMYDNYVQIEGQPPDSVCAASRTVAGSVPEPESMRSSGWNMKSPVVSKCLVHVTSHFLFLTLVPGVLSVCWLLRLLEKN